MLVFRHRRLNRRWLKTSIGAVVQRLHFWGFLSLHALVKPTVLFKSVGAIDQVAVGAVTASYWEKAFTG